MGWAASMADQAGWRQRRSYRRKLDACSEKEAQALGRWYKHGAPEARSLDRTIAEGERAVEDLGRGRDRWQQTLDSFDLDRTRSRLSHLSSDIYALRDRLNEIEPPSVARDWAERSVLRPRRGLDHDHDLGYEPYRGISSDVGHGIGR